MRIFLPILASALALAQPANAQVQADLGEARATPVLALTIAEEVTRMPDIVRFSIGISEERQTAREAVNAATRQIERVADVLVAAGIDRNDITTGNISLNQRYEYDERQPRFVGFVGGASLTFDTDLEANIAAILDVLAAADVKQINGPMFDLEDRLPLRAEARRRALERADREASEYARLRGFARARLVGINASPSHVSNPIVVTGQRLRTMDVSAPPPPPPSPERGGGPLLGAEISEQVTLQLVYTLEN